MQVSCLACCSDIKTVSVIPGKRLKTTKRGNLTIAIRQIEAFALPFEVGGDTEAHAIYISMRLDGFTLTRKAGA